MYANLLNVRTLMANAEPVGVPLDLRVLDRERTGLEPHAAFQLVGRDARLAAQRGPAARLIPADTFETDVARKAMMSGAPVLRPAVDSLGRTVILAYVPGPQSSARAEMSCEVLQISMLHFGDSLRLAARKFGMSNLAARICRALVENGSLRQASRSLRISHQTASSEMRDALQAAGVHSQSGLICGLAAEWLKAPLETERTIGLLMKTFGLKQRDAQVAIQRAVGLTRPEAAARLGVSQWAVESSCATVFATLGAAKAPDLTRIVIDLLLTADLAERYSGQAIERAAGAERATFRAGS